jgi:hypothetical protein
MNKFSAEIKAVVHFSYFAFLYRKTSKVDYFKFRLQPDKIPAWFVKYYTRHLGPDASPTLMTILPRPPGSP